MAGKAREKSPTEKRAAQLRDEAAKAKDKANKPNATAADKQAAEKAIAAAKAATQEENRERFLNIGGSRAGTVIAKLDAFSKIASPRSYSFTESDIKEAFDAIEAKTADAKEQFLNALKSGGKTAPAAKTFKFSAAK